MRTHPSKAITVLYLSTIVGLTCIAVGLAMPTHALFAQERSERTENRGDGTLDIRMEGNDVVITDAEGNVERIPIGNRGSFRMSQRTIVDAEGNRHMEKHVIVVDENGQVHEFSIRGDAPVEEERRQRFRDSDPRERLLERFRDRDETRRRFMLGVGTQEMEREEREEQGLEDAGLRIVSVFDDSPASQAGIRDGDVVVKVDGEAVTTTDQLSEAVQRAGAEERELKLELLRNGETVEIEVRPSRADRGFGGALMPDLRRRLEGQLTPEQMHQLQESLQMGEQQLERAIEQQREAIERAIERWRERGGEGELRLEQAWPRQMGLGPELMDDLRRQMEEMREKLDELRRERQQDMEDLRRKLNELIEDVRNRQPE